MKNNLNRTAELVCPTCANSQFSFDEELPPIDRMYKCTDCGNTFSHSDMLDSNDEIIQNTIEEVKTEIVNDIRQDFKKMFKKFK